ncbi:MAG: hypothetical protein K5773_09865 [Pseudobutyrivibrio sp.]|nr:hypothetical protein [Pseudobutyrivibrio sp.]
MVKKNLLLIIIIVNCIFILILAAFRVGDLFGVADTKSIVESNIELKEIKKNPTFVTQLPEGSSYTCIGCTNNYVFFEVCADDDVTNLKYCVYNLSTGELMDIYRPVDWSYIFNPTLVDDALIITVVTNNSSLNDLNYQVIKVEIGGAKKIFEGHSCFYPQIVALKNGIAIESFSFDSDYVESEVDVYDFEKNKKTKLISTKYIEEETGEYKGQKVTYIGSIDGDLVYCVSDYGNNSNGENIDTHDFYIVEENGKASKCRYQPGYECKYYAYQDNVFIANRRSNGSMYSIWTYLYEDKGDRIERIAIPSMDTHLNGVNFLAQDKIYLNFSFSGMIVDLKNMQYWEVEEACTCCEGNFIYYVKDGELYMVDVGV